ncbi:putative cytochrome P450 6a14 [Xylocopa sonorina]|uniref:putative cytochrome P450 6a14 n=1 Tax=Xylocopa sonorina TaxID=1818115 RepID=UPI00403AAECA
MNLSVIELFGLVVGLLFLCYQYSLMKFKFWEKRGVKSPKPIPFFGNFKDMFLGRVSFSNCLEKVYYEYKDEPMVGLYQGHLPLLVLRDPELLKYVFIKDFPMFADRTITPAEKVEPLSVHLFRLDSERWRPLRSRLTPVFTSGKLKNMFHLLLKCSDSFEEYLGKMVEKGEPIECHNIAGRYTTDVIGSCAFGIDMNTLGTEDSEFRTMSRRALETNWRTVIRDRLRNYPRIYNIFAPFVLDYEIVEYFRRIVKDTIDHRIEHDVSRHDFVDVLVDLKQHPEKLGTLEVDDMFLTAQAFVFFIAGFETSSVTICNALYEFALNPSIQEKARADVKEVLEKTNGVITYDSIKEMKYLDACFNETLRKYPVLLWLSRIALADYTFPGTKVSIPKGQPVFCPLFAIHRDPEIYPNPDVFDPERFNEDNAKTRHPMHFLPFGDGPRNCIGARFAKIQSKVALIKVLNNFKVEVCEKTCKDYIIDKKALFLLQPSHGVYVKLTKLAA